MKLQRLRRSTRRWILFVVAPTFIGCYSYIPAEIGGPVRGTPVRTGVRTDPTFQVGDRIVHDVSVVEGQVISWGSDSLALSAEEVRSAGGESFDGQGYTVKLARADLYDLAVKRLDKKRTVLLAIGTVAGAILAAQSLTGGFWSRGGGGGGGQVK